MCWARCKISDEFSHSSLAEPAPCASSEPRRFLAPPLTRSRKRNHEEATSGSLGEMKILYETLLSRLLQIEAARSMPTLGRTGESAVQGQGGAVRSLVCLQQRLGELEWMLMQLEATRVADQTAFSRTFFRTVDRLHRAKEKIKTLKSLVDEKRAL